MKNKFIILLVAIMVFICAACTSGKPKVRVEGNDSDSVNSSRSSSAILKYEVGTYLPEELSEHGTPINTMVDLMDEVKIIDRAESEIHGEIVINGTYNLPPVSNDILLQDTIPTIYGGAYIIAAEIANGSQQMHLENLKFHPSYIQEAETVPVAFLRNPSKGYYYSVAKIHDGGYAYFFFERLRDSITGEYTTSDLTDVRLSGGVYVEKTLPLSSFAHISIGDTLEDVISTDNAAIVPKQWSEWMQQAVNSKPEILLSNHLLTDGLLTFTYALKNEEYIITDIEFSEEFTFTSPWFEDGFHKTYTILPQDYPP